MPISRRIAFLCPRFPEGPTVGGAETLLKNLAVRAARAGRTVSFLTTCARNHFTWENEAPPGTRRIGNLDVSFFPVDPGRDVEAFLHAQERICRAAEIDPSDEKTWRENSMGSSALMDYLAREAKTFDRIVAGPYLFELIQAVARLYPGKTVLVPCLHDEPFARLSGVRCMFQSVSRFMFNTEPEQELARRLLAAPSERCSVVGMGIDPFQSDAAATARELGFTSPYVFYCGRREPMKGTPLLLHYLSAFRARTGRDINLVLAGSGPVEPPPGMTGHVFDIGFVSEQAKHNAMAGAVAFCHPSVNESLGIVLLESWLAGAPALVRSDCRVLQWQCRRSNGGLWFGMYPEFEEELMLLLGNAELRKRLAEAGRQYVLTEYNWDRVEKNMLASLDC